MSLVNTEGFHHCEWVNHMLLSQFILAIFTNSISNNGVSEAVPQCNLVDVEFSCLYTGPECLLHHQWWVCGEQLFVKCANWGLFEVRFDALEVCVCLVLYCQDEHLNWLQTHQPFRVKHRGPADQKDLDGAEDVRSRLDLGCPGDRLLLRKHLMQVWSTNLIINS